MRPVPPDVLKHVQLMLKPSGAASAVLILTAWAIVLVTAWLHSQITDPVAFWITYVLIVAPVIASRQRAFENLNHEGGHGNLAGSPRANLILSWLVALPVGHNPVTEGRDHGFHHWGFWGPDDMDLWRYVRLGLIELPAASVLALGGILWRGYPIYVADAARYFFLPRGEPRAHRITRIGFWAAVLVVVLATGVLGAFTLYWVVPLVFFLMPMRFVGEVSEHAGLGCSDEIHCTRSNIGALQRFFLHPYGDGYHLLHHLLPEVPPHRASAVHAVLMREWPEYRDDGRHCYGLLLSRPGRPSTLSDLVATARGPRSSIKGRFSIPKV